ncbi:AAA family ATPase [Streptococcus equinus]|uniref:AAA family ATPase n=1 Tax=Streptococcus equinus TaxID=1335 RepID=UPI003BF857AA
MVNNNGDERNDIDYLWLMEYLENNRGLAYSNPDKAAPTDADKFKKIRDKGRKVSEIMGKMARLCESRFNLEFCDRYVSWLDGSNTKTRKYLWAQLKYDEYKKDPISISLFVDMSERTNHARFRFSLEIKDDSSDRIELAKYHKHLELPLPSDSSLVYVSGSNEFSNPIVLDEDQQVIKSKVESGEYDKVQICKVVEWSEQLTNAEIEKEMLAGIDELIPYYNYVIGYNSSDLSAQVEEGDKEVAKVEFDKNMILFGPPGTGKTYNTAIYAVAICDKLSLDEVKARPYEEVLDRYRVLKSEEKRVAFTTFHQSFGYEEFIEGIKPKMDSDSTDIEYTVKDGVFKEFCERASKKTSSIGVNVGENARVWNVILGGNDDPELKQRCFNEGTIRIGWNTFPEVITDETEGLNNKERRILLNFQDEMEIGDVVVARATSDAIDGVAIITGGVEFDTSDEYYPRKRQVQWLYKGDNISIIDLNGGTRLDRKSVYPLNRISVGDLLSRVRAESVGFEVEDEIRPYVFIIDEINRGNISKIFGELITLIEPSKRKGEKEALEVTLPYSNVPFGVPNNVYLIGTMNTADRSIAIMDTALRRRFQFEEMMPNPKVLRNIGADKVVEGNVELDVAEMLEVINKRIEYLFDREHTIGHAFFTELKYEPTVQKLASIFKKSVIPLLQEYFYEDYSKIRMVLGDNGKENAEHMFILANEIKSNQIFRGDTSDIDIPDYSYVIQDKAFDNIMSYKEII